MEQNSFVIVNLIECITLKPLVDEGRFINIQPQDLGRIPNSWIAVDQGKIAGIGQGPLPNKFSSFKKFDGTGCIALPGLIDAHTHPVFAGIRSKEFCMRLDGATYQEIAAKGGGIKSTVADTAHASDSALEALLRMRLQTFASHGVTTVEVKSGYGLTINEELRHLRIIKKVSESSKQKIMATCLALHAIPADQPSAKAWADLCARELLPVIKNQSLASAVDAFIENGYFSVSDCELYLSTAKKLGLDIRIHADEFSNSGGARYAAMMGAKSADHLQFADQVAISEMARSETVALLLPGTSLYTSIPYTNSRPFKSAGCPVGLATDFNPGSCPVDNLRLVMTMGALHCGLTFAEAIAAVTLVPAKSLGLEHSKGALALGFDADILLMPVGCGEEFVADLGRTKPRQVFANGEILN